jgi:DGQHR domain-containing protein
MIYPSLPSNESVHQSRGGSGIFFEVISARYETGSVIATSNKGSREWGTLVGDPVLATAILDRLLHHATVLNIRGESYSARLPNAYRSEGERMGFLTIERGERIVLDGQHRWYALRDVIQSADELGDHQGKVGDDDVTVIIIENEDPRKTRRIFNKVNRHAKPTGRADNIVTSEDDGYAWVTRHLLDRDAPLAAREIIDGGATIQQELVNWRSNTLSKGMRHLTTISALYESVGSILGFEGVRDLDRIVTPSDQDSIRPMTRSSLGGRTS